MIGKIVIVSLAAFSLSACQVGTKQGIGGLLGAGAGAVAGSNIGGGQGKVIAVAAGTLLGLFFGSEIGKSLDNADKALLIATTERTMETVPSGETTNWNNPDSGNSGTITPTNTYQNENGSYCREYSQTIDIGGKEETAFGKACRQPDGSWKII